jgi:hypothetical protein
MQVKVTLLDDNGRELADKAFNLNWFEAHRRGGAFENAINWIEVQLQPHKDMRMLEAQEAAIAARRAELEKALPKA